MKNAASRENRAMSDEMAYSGTLWSDVSENNPHDHDPYDRSLQAGFSVILQL
jgi:hypothetical protein